MSHCLRSVLAVLTLAVTASATAAQQPDKTPPPKPTRIVSPSAVPTALPQADLQIMSFEFVEWEKCPSTGALARFRVRVRNGGTASSRGGVPLRVSDEHFPSWTKSQGLPALGVGEEVQQFFSLLPRERAHEEGAAPHPFVAVIDPDHTVVDLNPRNNRAGPRPIGRPCT